MKKIIYIHLLLSFLINQIFLMLFLVTEIQYLYFVLNIFKNEHINNVFCWFVFCYGNETTGCKCKNMLHFLYAKYEFSFP